MLEENMNCPPAPLYLRDAEPSLCGRRRAIFRCSCGNEFRTDPRHIKSGQTKSCGCWRILVSSLSGPRSTVHGHTRNGVETRTYKSWAAMTGRCLNDNGADFPKWGAVGVTICERWRTFENFLADMGERPSGMTLDRYPNPHGNYEPANCRWATPMQQGQNRRNNARFYFHGEKLTISQIKERAPSVIDDETIRRRVKRGWPMDEALTRPLKNGAQCQ